MAEANAVDLDEKYAKKVRNGSFFVIPSSSFRFFFFLSSFFAEFSCFLESFLKAEKTALENNIKNIKEGTEEWYDAKDQIEQVKTAISDIAALYPAEFSVNNARFTSLFFLAAVLIFTRLKKAQKNGMMQKTR